MTTSPTQLTNNVPCCYTSYPFPEYDDGDTFYSLGWDYMFASFSTWYTDEMQGTISISYLQALYGCVFLGWQNDVEVINNSNNQVGPIVTLTVFGLLGMFPIMLLVYLFRSKLIYPLFRLNKKPEDKKSFPLTERIWAVQAVLYFVFIVLLIVGMALFGPSMISFNKCITHSSDVLLMNKKNIIWQEEQGINELNCYSKNIESTFKNASAVNMKGPVTTVDIWMNANGVDRLNTFDEASLAENYLDLINQTNILIFELQALRSDPVFLKNQICSDEMITLSSQLNLVLDVLGNLSKLMAPIITDTNSTITGAFAKRQLMLEDLQGFAADLNSRILITPSKIDNVLNSTSKVAVYDNMVSARLNDFYRLGFIYMMGSIVYIVILVLVYLLVYTPSVLVVLSLIVALLISLAGVRNKISKFETGRLVRISTLLLQIGSFTVFATTWYLMVLVILIFWLSTALSASCTVLGDYQYNSGFYSLPDHAEMLEFTNFEGRNMTMAYSKFRMEQFDTVFAVLSYSNGIIMDQKGIMNYININSSQTQSYDYLKDLELSTYFPQDIAQQYRLKKLINRKESFSQLQGASTNTTLLQNILTTVSSFTDQNEERTRNQMLENNDYYYLQLVANEITGAVGDLMNGLLEHAWETLHREYLYDTSARPVCEDLRFSLNQIWASIFWIVIFMWPAAFLLRYTARKLKERTLLEVTPTSETVQTETNEAHAQSDVPIQPEEIQTETLTIFPPDYSEISGIPEEAALENTNKSGVWG